MAAESRRRDAAATALNHQLEELARETKANTCRICQIEAEVRVTRCDLKGAINRVDDCTLISRGKIPIHWSVGLVIEAVSNLVLTASGVQQEFSYHSCPVAFSKSFRIFG